MRGPGGEVETVNYLTLTSMLLNELQKRTAENQQQAERIAVLEERLSGLESTLMAARKRPSGSEERPAFKEAQHGQMAAFQ